jgi:hypothetical protein
MLGNAVAELLAAEYGCGLVPSKKKAGLNDLSSLPAHLLRKKETYLHLL